MIPVNGCDPPGFPRIELYDFREMQIEQTKTQVLMLYELDANYRVIWTDGRKFPEDPAPRWFGYSTGKWVDDYTFEVTTIGLNPKSWIDHAGRPHTGDMKVVEQFHRVDFDTIELTMTIIDPKYYSQPWPGPEQVRSSPPAGRFRLARVCLLPVGHRGLQRPGR